MVKLSEEGERSLEYNETYCEVLIQTRTWYCFIEGSSRSYETTKVLDVDLVI